MIEGKHYPDRQKTAENREKVQKLAREGYSDKEIAEKIGLSRKTVYQYRTKMEQEDGYIRREGREKNINIRADFAADWTETVNRYRKCYGKKPFPMPKERI